MNIKATRTERDLDGEEEKAGVFDGGVCWSLYRPSLSRGHIVHGIHRPFWRRIHFSGPISSTGGALLMARAGRMNFA